MMNSPVGAVHNAEIHMPTRVTFADGSDFRKKLLAAFDGNIRHLSVNLSTTEFMDSAGLGMLLVALKECGDRNISLTLVGPRGEVKRLLDLTRSSERFHIV